MEAKLRDEFVLTGEWADAEYISKALDVAIRIAQQVGSNEEQIWRDIHAEIVHGAQLPGLITLDQKIADYLENLP